MKPTFRHFLELHLVVLILGFTAILGLLVTVSPLALVFWRTGLAAIGLWVVNRGLQYRIKGVGQAQFTKSALLPPNRIIFKFLAIGVLVAAHWLLFFGAARVANASVCLAGIATASLWTALLEPLLTGRRLSALEIVLGLIVLAGLYVIVLADVTHLWGLLLAVVSAGLAALFSILNAQFTRHFNALTMTFWEMLGACLTTAVALLIYYGYVSTGTERLSFWPIGIEWLWILVLAGACTVYAYSATVRLLRVFSAFSFNLAINLEPVYGIGLAVLIFGDRERMTSGFYVGAVTVLAAVLIYPWLDRRMGKAREIA
ncbi:MAG: DMT family transporter [Cytophagaceae bacterium]|nr:DMT family transporter [Cytophagaceae bacterium]